MHHVLTSIVSRGGLAATHELYADGFTRADLALAVRRKTLIRVRQGWYAASGTHPTVLAAIRVGGHASCLTGLKLHGFWTPPSDEIHVRVAAHASRLRTPRDSRRRLEAAHPGVRIHWRDIESAGRLMLSPLDCLVDLLLCQNIEVVLMVADSVLHNSPDARRSWSAFVRAAPARQRRSLELVDGVCESGTETLTWHRLRPFNFTMRRQVTIPGIGRVDFVIGRRLVIEVDGLEYHVDPERFEADRRRDARLSAINYRVLRFSYKQVMERWAEVETAVVAAVLRGDHE